MHPLALPAPAPARGTTTRRLIVGGIVAALVGMAVIGLLTPATTATRIEGIQRAQDVLEHGGAPLLARIGGRYSPVGNTDDPGIYLYGSLIGWLAGQQDPVTSIKWLYMALYGFTLALYPWLFYRLLGSRAAAIAAPFAGLLLIASAGLFDVYSIMTWAAMTLLPILFVVRERWPRHGLLVLAAVMVAASFASSVRSQAGLPIALVALLLVALRPWTIRRRAAAALVLVLCYLSIMPLAFAGVRAYRESWVGDPTFGRGQPTSHPLWHNAYIGLGYLPNRWRIKWQDSVAAETVRQVKPHAKFLSREYLSTLRTLYFRVATDHPGYYLKLQAQKLAVEVWHVARYGFFAALLLPFMLILGTRRRLFRRWALFCVPALLLAAAQPLAAIPDFQYDRAGLAGPLGLLVVLAGAAALDPMLPAVRRGPRASLAALGAFSRGVLAARHGRTVVALSAAGVLLFAGSWAVAHPITDRATTWAQEHSGPPVVP